MNTFKKRFSKALSGLFSNASFPRALVACSGGVDSMALLDLLRKAGLDLVVCHLGHAQREDAVLDQALVEAYCTQHALKLVARELPLKRGASEAEMRKARYKALEEIAKEHGAVVFTGHHAQDNLETYLFRFIRGAHPQTLKGIAKKAQRGELKIARPLLDFTKDEITAYAQTNKLAWREDSTNSSLKYGRNQVRHQLLPLLEQLRPGASHRILHFFEALRRSEASRSSLEPARTFIEKLKSPEGVKIQETSFDLLKAAIDELLEEQSSRTTRSHWEGLQRQLDQRQSTRTGGGPQKTLQFPGGYALCFKQNRLFWTRPEKPTATV